MKRLSAVIPALNEERWIVETIASARESGVDEVIVSDGGSVDRTIDFARESGATVVCCRSNRGSQLNAGVAAATGDVFVFVHADTRLPSNARTLIAEAVGSGATSGGFLLQFLERDARLSFAASMINARTRITRCPWGDQGQFVTREMFSRSGGYLEQALMEDYEFALRMKKTGSPRILRSKVVTSGRRFLAKGLIRTSAINWALILRYRLGADPEALARIYRGSSSSRGGSRRS